MNGFVVVGLHQWGLRISSIVFFGITGISWLLSGGEFVTGFSAGIGLTLGAIALKVWNARPWPVSYQGQGKP